MLFGKQHQTLENTIRCSVHYKITAVCLVSILKLFWIFQDALEDKRRPPAQLPPTNNNNTAASCCKCKELSHPEIDRLRNEVENDLISLPPMIAALCKDKQLIQSTNQCTCNKPPISPRPISWHCGETGQAFSFHNSSKLDTAQACQ